MYFILRCLDISCSIDVRHVFLKLLLNLSEFSDITDKLFVLFVLLWSEDTF